MDNIQFILDRMEQVVQRHRLADGQYCRWLWQNAKGNRELDSSPYGCADAANILYTINRFPRDLEERTQWVKALQSFQDAQTGLFHESTHTPYHTTAHCIASLELFDAAPLHPLTEMHQHLPKGKLEAFLDGLDWVKNPWGDSHKGAGLYASMVLTGEGNGAWYQRYFQWLWDNADPEIGFWKQGAAQQADSARLFEFMAGGFHYLFNLEYANMPLRYPEKVIDCCLEMYDTDNILPYMGKQCSFIDIDWVFCLTRASRQTPHRHEEVKEHLRHLWRICLDFWRNVDWDKNESVNDLHTLFGEVCALAELQQALPGEIITDRPLRLVLDRRPFI